MRYRAAIAMIMLRFVKLKGSGVTMRLPFGLRACAAITPSISSFALAGGTLTSMATDVVAAWMEGMNNLSGTAVAGLKKTAARLVCGAISFTISSHLPPIAGSTSPICRGGLFRLLTRQNTITRGRGGLFQAAAALLSFL